MKILSQRWKIKKVLIQVLAIYNYSLKGHNISSTALEVRNNLSSHQAKVLEKY